MEFGIQKYRSYKQSLNIYINFNKFGIALFFPPRIKFFNKPDMGIIAIKFIFIWGWIHVPKLVKETK